MNQQEFELGETIIKATRAHAVERDANAGMAFELAGVWNRLCAAEWRIHDAFAANDRLYAIVRETGRNMAGNRTAGGLAMVEQVLQGRSSKAVAIDRNLSQSAVACAMRLALDQIGLDCKVRSVPHILVLAVGAARSTRGRPALGRISLLQDGPGRFWLISAERPELDLLNELTASERAVMTGLLEGRSYKELSVLRGTSTRTIANQLAMGFRKLQVSGRGEVLAQLMGRALDSEQTERGAGEAQVGVRGFPTATSRGSVAPNGFSQSGLRRDGATLGLGVTEGAGAGAGSAGFTASRMGAPRTFDGSEARP